MHQTLHDILVTSGEAGRVRAALLHSPVVQETELADVLADPAATLAELQAMPRVGAVSVARLKQAVARALAARAPREWAAAARLEAGGRADDPALDPARLAALARFRALWGLSAENLPVKGLFHMDYTDPGNTVIAAALTAETPFVYAPESCPEVLKTPAVFAAEQGRPREGGDYLARLQAALAEDVRLPAGSLILMDLHRLTDLADRHGPYATLTGAEAAEQLAILAAVLATLPQLHVVVTPFRVHGLASGFATADGPLFHYCFGGYLELRSPELVAHFHANARAAARGAEGFADWLSRIARAPERRDLAARLAQAGAIVGA
jgi:hypothetical protein